ncbi:hypothetical protein CEXT_67411 [Caerostris extrusa]|uniref:Uncharacterized protein n=1 Tax=Caerostris extrusa TaxID=172846 RepID=A0AAV4XRR3_CAEEX|nr:hypothetical protein CEXT_67411 [Caerostris extrusa]
MGTVRKQANGNGSETRKREWLENKQMGTIQKQGNGNDTQYRLLFIFEWDRLELICCLSTLAQAEYNVCSNTKFRVTLVGRSTTNDFESCQFKYGHPRPTQPQFFLVIVSCTMLKSPH